MSTTITGDLLRGKIVTKLDINAAVDVLMCCLAFALSNFATYPALAQSRDERLDHYAKVAAASIVAESHCPRFRVHAGQLTTLRMAIAISSSEERIIEDKLRSWAQKVRQAYDRNGANDWCSEVYDLLGPSGSMERGVLSK